MQLRVKDETIFFNFSGIFDIFISTRRFRDAIIQWAREKSGETEGHRRYNKSNVLDGNRYCSWFGDFKIIE